MSKRLIIQIVLVATTLLVPMRSVAGGIKVDVKDENYLLTNVNYPKGTLTEAETELGGIHEWKYVAPQYGTTNISTGKISLADTLVVKVMFTAQPPGTDEKKIMLTIVDLTGNNSRTLVEKEVRNENRATFAYPMKDLVSEGATQIAFVLQLTTESDEWDEYKNSGNYRSSAELNVQLTIDSLSVNEAVDDIETTYEEDNVADDVPGIVKYGIPIGVAVAITGWLTLMRKRKKEREDREKRREENDYDEEEQEEEEEEMQDPDGLEMEIYKDFGDTLTVGDVARYVSVCIVRKPAKGAEYVDVPLTMRVTAESDGYLYVEEAGMKNDWKNFYVAAPECEGTPPEEGYVTFTLANEEGSYTNRLHFKVVRGAIVFDPEQSNVTIPAHFPNPVSVPFVVVGIDERADMEVMVTMEDADGNITSDYDVELEPCNPMENLPYFAVIHDLKLDEKTDYLDAGEHLSYLLHVQATSGEHMVIDGYMPVFRYYMGLSMKVPDGGVGCYIEEYNPEKHFIHSFFKGDNGKQYARCQTRCFVRIFDYDLEKRCIVTKDPRPEDIVLKVEDIGSDMKETLDRINLSITGVELGEGKYHYFLFCRNDVLAPPNRLAVLATLTVTDGKDKYEVKQVLNLWSQPKRRDLTPEQWEQAIKHDDELEARLMKVDQKITEVGLRQDFDTFMMHLEQRQQGMDVSLKVSDQLELFGVERLHKLLKSIEILISSRDSNFGYDEDSVVAVEKLYQNYMRKRQIVYEREQKEAFIDMEEAMAPAGLKEYLYNRHKAFSEMNLVESMVLGVLTCGFSELLTTGVAVGANMYKEAEEGKSDYLFLSVWMVGAKTVTFNYLMEKGVKGVFYIAKSAGGIVVAFGNKFDNVFDLKKLKDKTFKEKVVKLWTATKEGARKAHLEQKRTLSYNALEKEVKEAVMGEVNTLTKMRGGFKTIAEMSDQFKKAKETANDLLYKAKNKFGRAKNVIPDSAVDKADSVLEAIRKNHASGTLDSVMEKANKRAEKKLLELEKLMNESRDVFASPEVAQKHLKMVLEIQSDKHAMNLLNSYPGLNRLKNDMNVTLRQLYKEVDDKVITRLSQITGIPKDDIMPPLNASGSSAKDLIAGKKVTYDRDVTYYYKNTDGKWCYFDQAGTEKLYDLEMQRTAISWTGTKGVKFGTAEASAKFGINTLDQTIIEDVLNHIESYGEDLQKMILSEFHHQGLNDPKKVATTVYNKGMHQIELYRSLMQQAAGAVGEAAEDLQIKALACLKEGCRQNVKTFKLIASRQAAREDLVGKQITSRLYQGIAILDRFASGEATPNQVEIALGMLGYTYDSITKELSIVAKNIG